MGSMAARVLRWLGHLLDTVTERTGRWTWQGYWQYRSVRRLWRNYIIAGSTYLLVVLVLVLWDLAR